MVKELGWWARARVRRSTPRVGGGKAVGYRFVMEVEVWVALLLCLSLDVANCGVRREIGPPPGPSVDF